MTVPAWEDEYLDGPVVASCGHPATLRTLGFRDRCPACVARCLAEIRTWETAATARRAARDAKLAARSTERMVAVARQAARNAGAPITLTHEEWLITLADFDRRCAYCQKTAAGIVEHVDGVAAGTTAWNCLPACETCNYTKRDLPLEAAFPLRAAEIRAYLATRRAKGAT